MKKKYILAIVLTWIQGITWLSICCYANSPKINQLAGVKTTSPVSFNFKDVFFECDDLAVALDLNLHPDKRGHSYKVYIVLHKNAGQWVEDRSLTDVRPQYQEIKPPVYPVKDSFRENIRIVWTGMELPNKSNFHQGFDVVLDFNLNDRYDKETDIIDRIGVLENEDAQESGGVTLLKKLIHDVCDSESTSIQEYKSLEIKGKLYFPSESQWLKKPKGGYPLIIIAHGGHSDYATHSISYKGFEYIGKQLACRGFVCASIDHSGIDKDIPLKTDMILKHLKFLLSGSVKPWIIALRNVVDKTNIGLLGHSKGGQAIVAVQDYPQFKVKALAALSPSDHWLDNMQPYNPRLPYLMIYGTGDGHFPGIQGLTGIRVFDRAKRPRHMIVIKGAVHNYFNSGWDLESSATAQISADLQRKLTQTYITAFFTAYLYGQQAYLEILSGRSVPRFMEDTEPHILYGDQPERLSYLTIDDFQDNDYNVNKNSLGNTNHNSGGEFSEKMFRFACECWQGTTYSMGNSHVHFTGGLYAKWNGASSGNYPKISFNINGFNAANYKFLNFRVGQRFRTTGNLNTENQLQNFGVTLSGADKASSSIPVSNFTSIYPNHKSMITVMQTVRIPLRSFVTDQSEIRLEEVRDITFHFNKTTSGELIFDDIELLGLNLATENVDQSPVEIASQLLCEIPQPPARDNPKPEINIDETICSPFCYITLSSYIEIYRPIPFFPIESLYVKMANFLTEEVVNSPKIKYEKAGDRQQFTEGVFNNAEITSEMHVIKTLSSTETPKTVFIGPVVLQGKQIKYMDGKLILYLSNDERLQVGLPITLYYGGERMVLLKERFNFSFNQK